MPSLVRRCALPLSVTVVAGVLTALPAAAAPTWVPAVAVQDDGLTVPTSPVVAVDAEGAATMAWLSFADPAYTVQTSSHPVGGAWSPPQDLSGPNAVPGELDLAEDAAGDAVVAWTEGVAPDRVVRVRTRAAGGAWSTADTLSDPAADSSEPTVGIDGAGNVVALWVSDGDTVGMQPAVVGATKSLTGAWSTAFPLSDPENGAEDPDVAVAPDGRATAVWTHFDADPLVDHQVIETSSRPAAAAAFELPPTIISALPTTVDAARPSVAVNGAGAVAAAWEERTGPDASAIRAAIKPANDAWGTATTLSVPLADPSDFDENGGALVVLDSSGTSTVVWRRHHVVDAVPFPDHFRTVEAASAPAGQGWTGPTKLGDTSSDSGVGLASDAAGNLTAVWPSEGLLSSVAEATRPAGAAWGVQTPIGTPDGRTSGVTAAADPAGDVVVGYGFTPYAASVGTLYARAFDVAGPLTRSLSIPGTGTAGQPTSYTVTPADAWSPVLSTVWSFGDGTTASGPNVTHTFAAAGSYAVSVTTTDAAGNTRTQTGTTAVAAAPVVVMPPPATPKPSLTGVKLTTKTIHVVKSDASPRSTKLKLTLSSDAAVKVMLKRTKKVDGKAVKATTSKALKKGASSIKLTSKVDGLQLPPGTYKVTVTAKNGVGTSKAVVVTLTIKA